jgi:hypothetical protein
VGDVHAQAHRLAVLDVLGYTDEDAAAYLGIPVSRLKRIRKSQAYTEAYTAIATRNILQLSSTATAALSGARELIAQSLGRAIQTILELMQDPSTPASVRLQAANSLLMRAGLTAKTTEFTLRGLNENQTPTIPASSSPELIRALADLVEAIKQPIPAHTEVYVDAEPVLTSGGG